MLLSWPRTGLKKKLSLSDNNYQKEQVDKTTDFCDITTLHTMKLMHKRGFAETFKIKKKVVIYQVIIVTYILLGIFLII